MVKIFQFLRLTAKFLAVLRLTVNPIETLLGVAHTFIAYIREYHSPSRQVSIYRPFSS